MVYSQMTMLEGPRETVGHVTFIKKGFFTGNARAKASSMDRLTDGIDTHRRLGLLLPCGFDLVEAEAAFLVFRHEPLER